MELATKLCGFDLEHPLMNAAGTCKTLEELRWFVHSARVTGIVVGSITVDSREMPRQETYHRNRHRSLNALKLPNPGELYYEEHLPTMKQLAVANNILLLLSVAGFSGHQFARLASLGERHQVDLIELDFGSMTVQKESGHDRIITYDPDLVQRTLHEVFGRVGQEAKVGLKLAPITDPAYLRELAGLLAEFPVAFVTCCNTIPYGIPGWYETSLEYGGIGGPALRSLAMSNVKQFRAALPESVDIIGVGGIESADDVVGYRMNGAAATALATAHHDKVAANMKDCRVFTDIIKGLERHPAIDAEEMYPAD